MRKLKSFTIVEAIVVLILSSIVITIAYTSISIISGRIYQFKDFIYKSEAITSFEKILLNDITTSEYVIRSLEGFKCITDEKVVEYNIQNGSVTRVGLASDIFNLEVSELKTFFQGNENAVPGSILDHIRISILIDNSLSELIFTKRYGSNVLMNEKIISNGN